jgi:hypothetical protein
LRLVTSPNHLYKKLEEYGVHHDEIIKSMVKNDAKWLVSRKEEDDSNDTSASVTDAKPSAGFKLTIDNVDYMQNVHYMTEEHQNNDKHYRLYSKSSLTLTLESDSNEMHSSRVEV